ncbi:MAG: RluA family pseudouridine synthase [Syntrophales bacterium]|jgi:23S rRNA pseudouridine1911/1915/1917 synthase|nr:RluA family pseudouridine synthase [Syntrophales bacterium]
MVSPEEEGLRLDLFVAAKAPELSRSQVKRMIEEGNVRINTVQADKAGARLRDRDRVDFTVQPARPWEVVAENIPLQILYEDQNLLVMNKPAGMVVHPSPGHREGTLVNALLHHCDDLSGIGGVVRPGIVHRLDKDTSGVLLVAKNDETHRHLSRQFKGHHVKKTYKALVFGNPAENEGTIALPVGRHPENRKKMSIRSHRGKEAVSHWRVMRRYGDVSLLDVEIETGRTHQIRVHLSAIGHPVVGDRVYGGGGRIKSVRDTTLRARLDAFPRQALHAWRIAFLHPALDEEMIFSAPLTDDLQGILCYLESKCR